MRLEIQLMLILSGISIPFPTLAQSEREEAVAIDQIEIPSNESLSLEQIGAPLARPWSLAFLPDGRMVVTEKHGGIRLISPDGKTSAPLKGEPPNIFRKSDSGLLDIVLDPDFAANNIVYIAFAEGDEAANRTAIWKARLDKTGLEEGRVIFRVNEPKKGPSHPGGRMLFLPDNTLLLSIGDGYDLAEKAQDNASHLGKILRLTRDGSPAPDNPFIRRPGFAPEIFTLGHRNIQGLAYDQNTDTIWSHEHGPRGGDEVNQVQAGQNYAWPRATFGIDYDGTIVSERNHEQGMGRPHFFWSPSIAPSGLAIYRGDKFPNWDGHFLVGGLANRALIQLEIGRQTGLLVERGRWLQGLKARIRDVRVSPDGQIYLLTDEDKGRLLRVIPEAEKDTVSLNNSLRPLGFLIGQWTGETVLTRADNTNQPPSRSSARTHCAPKLQGSYIVCKTRFTNDNGKFRSIEMHVHAKADGESYDALVFNSNSPIQSPFSLNSGQKDGVFTGYMSATVNDQPARERITIKPSQDGAEIEYIESYQYDTDREDKWTETFNWQWKKVR